LSVLAAVLSQSTGPVNISLPPINVPLIVVRLVALLPLIGGYLLAREGKGNLLLEISAVVLLVLATVVPTTKVTMEEVPGIVNAFLLRLPAVLFLLGLAFVRDGGIKMILGILLMAVSGLVLLPTVNSH
jgi:hypothetical protein